ncbi:enoyl-CoA hydratase/isomerase family protein [Ornithinimicrobium flavum]|uniref:enoyl-CoA hydratase/isomerase family protein n=1 Tax=Ornithinimicrobium flavum TaxID=1288636 RepID=UPI00106F36CB|nr:enoyl-CoA hydratase/isomerase family protein [Ornithinimicrobium flavum]
MSEDVDQLSWAPAPGHGEEVLYAVDGPLGRVRLNRPRAINAIDGPMIGSLHDRLHAWAGDVSVAAVVIDGAGDRGLCAGGDVRAVRESVLAGRPEEASGFWRTEYAVNALVAAYPKPYVAWMDGIVMGGGVGLSSHGSVRLVTERTRLAMPETIIGLFPDVGGTYLLSRAPGELGTYAALTGASLSGADAVLLGLADAVVPSGAKAAVLRALREDPAMEAEGLAAAAWEETAGAAAGRAEGSRSPGADDLSAPSELLDERAWIDACFAGDDAPTILARLRSRTEPAAAEAAEAIAARSPHSVAVTLEALRRAAGLTVEQVLEQDLVVGSHLAVHPDFAEGVRAQLVDKDRQPRWVHASLEDVTRAEVLAAFGEG